jgi:histidyl-tRNA synthetase
VSEGAAKSAKPRRFHVIRGVQDVLPSEMGLWNYVERRARQVFERYGFAEIRLPLFEAANLFEKTVGEDTDIVGKELYYWVDSPKANKGIRSVRTRAKLTGTKPSDEGSAARSELLKQADEGAFDKLSEADLLALRPEATASVCRAYVEHEMQSLTPPVRLYYTGPMFRRERPQKGRYRQFYQIGAEVLEGVRSDGTVDPAKELAKDAATDAEVIEMLVTFFDNLGLRGSTLYINSIGHNAENCRRAYVKRLKAELIKIKDKLGSDSQRRIDTNPLRVLDSKVESEQPYIEKLPHIANHLCSDCAAHYLALKSELELRGVNYQENWRLVRGLDYYMRTTFEITAPGLGSQNAVCGGGRYDGLVELLGGPPTKGIGFAIGEDRLILSLKESIADIQTTFDETLPSFATALQRPDLAVGATTKETWDQATQLATSLRKRGLSVFLPRSGTKLPRVFDMAHRLGIRVAILVGEDELRRNTYGVRVLSPLDPNAPRDFSVQTRDVTLYGKIVKLRQDLERGLLRLAAGKPDLNMRHNLSLLVERLLNKELLPLRTAGAVKDILPMLNRAIHGEELAPDSVEWALAYGNLLLNELENLSPSEV